MGNQPKQESIQDWKSISKAGNCTIKTNSAGDQIQLYTVIIHQDKEHSMLAAIHSRKAHFKPGSHVAQIIDLKPVQDAAICSSFHNFFLILQRIPFRLAHVPTMPLQQSLPLFLDIVKGYQNVADWYKGCNFDVTSDMIGLAIEGGIRVWFHSEFDQTCPEIEIIASPLNDTQHNLVAKLLQIFHQMTAEDDPLLLTFQREITSNLKQPLRFKSMYQFIESFGDRNYIDLKSHEEVLTKRIQRGEDGSLRLHFEEYRPKMNKRKEEFEDVLESDRLAKKLSMLLPATYRPPITRTTRRISQLHTEKNDERGQIQKKSVSILDPKSNIQYRTQSQIMPFQNYQNKSPSLHQPLQQPLHQPLHQPFHQPLQQPLHQPLNQPLHQPLQQPLHQPLHQPLQQPLQQPFQQTFHHTMAIQYQTKSSQQQPIQQVPMQFVEKVPTINNSYPIKPVLHHYPEQINPASIPPTHPPQQFSTFKSLSPLEDKKNQDAKNISRNRYETMIRGEDRGRIVYTNPVAAGSIERVPLSLQSLTMVKSQTNPPLIYPYPMP